MDKIVVDKPWGKFEQFVLNKECTIKILTVNPGEALSLQYHHHRNEFWRVVSGDGKVILDGQEHDAKTGDEFFIKKQTKHRAIGGSQPLVFLEIAFGNFDEEDIVRLEDKYNRIK